MNTSPKDKLLGIEKPILMKLCLYYIYGPVDFKELVPLFNRNYAQKLTVKRIKDAYGYMHDAKDPSFEEARDMNRDNREQCGCSHQRLKLTMSKMQLTLHL